jgi:hypothetical protein
MFVAIKSAWSGQIDLDQCQPLGKQGLFRSRIGQP